MHACGVKRAAIVRDLPTHPLGRELYEHVRNNGAIFDLLREVTLDGLFYRDLTQPEHEWADDRLWHLLGYDGPCHDVPRQSFLHAEDRERAQAELVRCTRDPSRAYDCVLRYRRRDASILWVRCRGLVLRDEEGSPVRLLATHVDLTELERTRQALQRMNLELEARVIERTRELSETMTRMADRELAYQTARARELRELVEGLPLLVWTSTPDGRCDYLSSQWVTYTGKAEAEQLGSGWMRQVHEQDLPMLLSTWHKAVVSSEPFDSEFRIRRHDGTYRWFKTRASPMRGPDGAVVKWFGTNTDIHERKTLEETLRDRTAALERSNEELEELAYLASHDLQEPLRSVTSYVQLLERHYAGQLDQRAREYISHAVAGARRMRNLVTDLLDYSRAVARADEVRLADGSAALDSALEAVSALLVETSARVHVMRLPKLAIDEASLSRILQNLLSNALHYRTEAVPRIEVRCEVSEGWAQISIADNGIGIAPQHHRRIFQMFERLHTADDRPGTGVGLALCKRLVERASGQIWLASEVGRGSTFFIRLPLAASMTFDRVGDA